jgi:hypothetical protein
MQPLKSIYLINLYTSARACCCLVFVGFADLMGRNVLKLALENGWTDAAVNLKPVRSVHLPITQPILALWLSLRG